MNDILPILLPILAALVVLGALIPVLMKTRKNITNYPGKRDENDPVQPGAGSGTLLEDRPAPARERPAPDFVDREGMATVEVPDNVAGLETVPVETPLPVAGRLIRLRERLVKSNNILGKGLLALLSADKIDEDVWDEVEETLLLADLGTEPTLQLVDALRERVKVLGTRSPEQVKALLREELIKLVDPTMDRTLRVERHADKPAVVLVVGVNGVGKTTTVGKLARVLVAEDKDVLLGAADTFRAAAAEQLATWGQRVGVATVKSDVHGADPASVAYEAVKAGIDQEVDVVMIDTAGRLQNKVGLMDELGKVKRVIEKLAEVDEVLLVLDATTGQNGLNQARVFAEVVNITGIVLTKLDGTAKGGIVVAIQKSLGVPVKLIGLGEGADDLAPFDAESFVDAILN
ncbi:signal recognition particle-docking protein FtsY [Arthrobacter sp. PsM3]|uniref:signal recognition particle-docking protein FtsY n=1 Tax=Arthrobacter sp. PsM3 TaxID=3030531 RepID=UPI00263AC2C0|nr:signal recognition particle-docking protein FtsY [Arthrobacter sp. PsM3]MDN4644005.1 signal recognition particle-docking protein FtsY [Arthrobacter sp. PsM3]